MKTVDVLIITFAVIALVGSVAGYAFYQPPPQEFTVSFSAGEPTPLASVSQEVSGTAVLPSQTAADEQEVVHDIGLDNLTDLSFEVQVSRPGSVQRVGDVNFRFTLVAPNGTEHGSQTATLAGDANSFSNAVVFEAPGSALNQPPGDTTVMADTIEEARAAIAGDNTRTAGKGQWTVEIVASFTSASTGPTGDTITVTSTPTATTYTASVTNSVDLGSTA